MLLQFAVAMEDGSEDDEREQNRMEEDLSSSSSNDESASDEEYSHMRTSTSGGLQSYLRERRIVVIEKKISFSGCTSCCKST